SFDVTLRASQDDRRAFGNMAACCLPAEIRTCRQRRSDAGHLSGRRSLGRANNERSRLRSRSRDEGDRGAGQAGSKEWLPEGRAKGEWGRKPAKSGSDRRIEALEAARRRRGAQGFKLKPPFELRPEIDGHGTPSCVQEAVRSLLLGKRLSA